MGNQPTLKFAWDFSFVIIEHNLIDNTLLLQKKTDCCQYLGRQIIITDIKDFQLIKKLVKIKTQNQNPFITKLKEVYYNHNQSYCSPEEKIFLVFQKPKLTLRQEILQRKFANEFFTEQQAQIILQSAAKAIRLLKQMQHPHNNISASSIFIDQERKVVLGDPWIVPPPYRQDLSQYIYSCPSPQKILLQNDQIMSICPYRSDLFTLGTVVLQALNFEHMDILYEKGFRRVIQAKVKQKLLKIKNEKLRYKLSIVLSHNPIDRDQVYNLFNQNINKVLNTAGSRVKPESEVKIKSQLKQEKEMGKNQFRVKTQQKLATVSHSPQVLYQMQRPENRFVVHPQQYRNIIINGNHFIKPMTIVKFNGENENSREIQKRDVKGIEKQLLLSNREREIIKTRQNEMKVQTCIDINKHSKPSLGTDNNKQSQNSFIDGHREIKSSQQFVKTSSNFRYASNESPSKDQIYEKMPNSPNQQVHNIANYSVKLNQNQQKSFQPSEIISKDQINESHIFRKTHSNQSQKGLLDSLNQYQNNENIHLIQQNYYDSRQTPEKRPNRKYNSTIKEEADDDENSYNEQRQNQQILDFVVQENDLGRYEGEKKNGAKCGFGTFYYKEGSIYEGSWKDNLMHGKGCLYYSNGKLAYEGELEMDQFSGRGKVYNKDQVIIEGLYDYTNLENINECWQSYEGELKSDRRHGKGKIKLSNGEIFVGNFEYDSVEGEGKYYTLNGKIIVGIWKSNRLIKRI